MIKTLWKKHRHEGESLRAFARRFGGPVCEAWLATKRRKQKRLTYFVHLGVDDGGTFCYS